MILHDFKGQHYHLQMTCEERAGQGHSRGDYYDHDYTTKWIGGEGKIVLPNGQMESFVWNTYPQNQCYIGLCLNLDAHLLAVPWFYARGEPARARVVDLIAERFLEQITQAKERTMSSFLPTIPTLIPQPLEYDVLFNRGLCYDHQGQAHFTFINN